MSRRRRSPRAARPRWRRTRASDGAWHRGARHRFTCPVATMKDLEELALAMPQATNEISDDGRPSYSVHGKYFCFHRRPRPDAVDEKTGERLDDVLVFRVEGKDVKELIRANVGDIFFTT